MSVFRCKMCGGTLDLKENETVATCEYCGTRQTVPRLDRERKIALYDRADHFRRSNEFDKAIALYEQILNEDNTDAESYWSLVLCRYGIEYVEDPSTHKRVPTVNRTQFTSIFDDEDYKAAIHYADVNQRIIYEEEAATINEIQKGILAISQREEPFDIFICYKETDKNGRRTPDSVIATDLYHQLTKEGFKVFFSRITLEDKLGTAYEPYIFAALNSAKVMVVIGTKGEYFNAAWVKNEWSRYLAIVKTSHGEKVLIPAYRDMDPYDLPEEFAHLQAQDMSKLGFMQDLLRGIRKIVQASTPSGLSGGGNTDVKQLLERASMSLEDGDFSKADELYEQVLNRNPRNAEAYLGKLLVELRLKSVSELAECAEPFDGSSNYEKAIRFADDELKAELTGYIDQINTRNENSRKQEIYDKAKRMMDSAHRSDEYVKAAGLFESVSGYEDSETQAAICRQKAEEAKNVEAKKSKRNKRLAVIFALVACAVTASVLVVNNIIIPNGKYNDAVELLEAGKYEDAYEAFESLGDYKDSAEKLRVVRYNEAVSLKESGNLSRAQALFTELGNYEDSKQQIEAINGELAEAAKAEVKQIKAAKIGDYVKFGAYEQDNDESNGTEPIEWRVLDSKDGKKLLISRYALDSQIFNDQFPKEIAWETRYNEGGPYEVATEINVTWETSFIREWLNKDFKNAAFSSEERKLIPQSTVRDENGPSYYYNKKDATYDKIFLLSYGEVNKYFNSQDSRVCESTAYANSKGVAKGRCWWWLRSMDYDGTAAPGIGVSVVDVYGDFGSSPVTYEGYAIRPAIWVDVD